ncbi:MAG: tetraacyldisaccharide 4'-kinase [Candidatus Omnitrophica bacterium]|nr:tetraacyldisaccharide 4'-kinase [Candidatus Omnitrophota bacterium]
MLTFLTPLYYLFSEGRRFLYQKGLLGKVRVPALVVSVGNITTGGTGKTTVTQYLANYFYEKGKRVAVISHGVSGSRAGLIISDGENILTDVKQAGDEAYLLARNLTSPEFGAAPGDGSPRRSSAGIPVLSGRRREIQARLACEKFGAEVIILDDAFHALRLHRDYDILVFNCLSRIGNGRLLPAGPLREPLVNIRRANIIWLNQTDLVSAKEVDSFQQEIFRFNPTAAVVKSWYRYRRFCSLSGESIPLEGMTGKKVWLCAAIGEPQSFIKKMEKTGVLVVGVTLFADHHFYTEAELRKINLETADFLVITEKDSVRFPSVKLLKPVVYPEIELIVEDLNLC